MKAKPESILSLAARTATFIGSNNPEQSVVDEIIKNSDHQYWATIKEVLNPSAVPKSEVKTSLLDLSSTGPTFKDWLTAREKLHEFLTGETISLCDMFVISGELLARTDIIPVFRPAGATNRMAVEWKQKLEIKVWEETDVDKYKNSEGPKVPELCFITRSIRPDENTLGDDAKSPDQLVQVKLGEGTSWLSLYGWADADNLHFKITGKHLDNKDTLTWFPNDRLPDGCVAGGGWCSGGREVKFFWSCTGGCDSYIGARLATHLTLKPKS